MNATANALVALGDTSLATTGVAIGGTTATTATAGTSGAAPAQVAGYIISRVNGTLVKIPYYAN